MRTPGRLEKRVTVNQSRAMSKQVSLDKPSGEKKKMKEYSRRPRPYMVMGSMLIRAMIGTKTQKYVNATAAPTANAFA